MRIIAGEWRGRTIHPPRDPRVRPTGDRTRESWLNILQPELPEATVADLFAGSGALGFEALSRGAAHCSFVEITDPGLRAIRENATALGARERCTMHRADAFRFIADLDPAAVDIVLADPPYKLGLAARLARVWLARPFSRILSVEHEAREAVPEGGDTRRYGSTAITIYRRAEDMQRVEA